MCKNSVVGRSFVFIIILKIMCVFDIESMEQRIHVMTEVRSCFYLCVTGVSKHILVPGIYHET